MKKGFTLIELIVILALFFVVSSLGFSLLISSKNMYSRSQENSDLYYQVRMGSDFIRDEIRNATELTVIPTPTSFSNDGYQYLFVEGNVLKSVTLGISVDKTSITITENIPMFTLSLDSSYLNTLSYTIEGTISNSKGTRTHSAPTTIVLNNIKHQATATGQCLKYKKP